MARARHLKDNREFVAEMDESAKLWDSHYPTFRIGTRGIPPISLPPSHVDMPFPPKLRSAIDDYNRALNAGTLDESYSTTDDGMLNWRRLTKSLSSKWWPAEHYWNWMGIVGEHPSMRFVSSCLLWQPSLVREDWIAQASLPIIGVPNPYDPAGNDIQAFESARFDSIVSSFSDATENEAVLTPELVRTAVEEAMKAGFRASRTAKERDHIRNYWVVALYPGITREDLRELEDDAIAAAGRMAPDLRSHAKRLMEQGNSLRGISHILGIDVRTVRSYVLGS